MNGFINERMYRIMLLLLFIVNIFLIIRIESINNKILVTQTEVNEVSNSVNSVSLSGNGFYDGIKELDQKVFTMEKDISKINNKFELLQIPLKALDRFNLYEIDSRIRYLEVINEILNKVVIKSNNITVVKASIVSFTSDDNSNLEVHLKSTSGDEFYYVLDEQCKSFGIDTYGFGEVSNSDFLKNMSQTEMINTFILIDEKIMYMFMSDSVFLRD